MIELEMCILNLIKDRDEDQPISREHLVLWTMHPDRANRAAIASLREQGYPICNTVGGYFWGEPIDVEVFCQRETRRAITILSRIKGMKPKLNKVINQLKLF